jgi:hypothetical protein
MFVTEERKRKTSWTVYIHGYGDLVCTRIGCSMTKTCQPHMAEAKVLHNPLTDTYNQTGQINRSQEYVGVQMRDHFGNKKLM